LGEQGGGEWLEQNSWRFGLERMLYGYAAGDAPAWRGVEPFDEVGGLEAGLVGPLADVLEALETARRQLREPLTPSEWGERLQALLARFFAAGDDEETVTLMRLETALQDWVEACAAAGLEERLPLAVVREPWLERLEEQGLSQRFFAGRVIFATLMPMRAIPFRHVYLLGMNDGDYPRARVPSDFDLMAGNYRPGDRSRREDDRYLFLEALLSARERLYVSWVGHRITDNAPQPPSVLVAQLREHLAAGWTGHRAGKKEPVQGEDLLAALTTEHRLQPFSPAYFPAESAQGALFTYAREWRARREAEPRVPSGPLQPPVLEEPLRVRELAQFLRHPVRSFLRDRLGVFLELEDPGSEEAEPFALDGLTLWSLRQEVIDAQRVALRQGRNVAAVRRAAIGRIRRRGVLPAGEMGTLWAAELEEGMDELFTRYQEALTPWPVEHAGGEEVRFAADGLELADWLGEWRRNGEGERARVLISPSELVKDGKYRPDRLAGYWVQHLAANAGAGPTQTIVLSRVGDYTFAPLGDAAAEPLAALLRAWAEGMRRPLPFAFQTALAWWKAWCKAPNKGEEEAWEAARKAYEGNGWTDGERDQDPYLARAWPRFADLRASGEFAHWAEVLLGPLLQYMEATKEGKKGAQA
jgi:exodeoxyribonuclease V gamma subunit